jgi:hypothetical protein
MSAQAPALKNLRRGKQPGVYIGRPSKWKNRFVLGVHGTREEVVRYHKRETLANPDLLLAIRTELNGRDLLCFCEPEECHGDLLLHIANCSDAEFEELYTEALRKREVVLAMKQKLESR